MSAVTTCPDRDVLTQLLLGRLAAAEAERLARHLEECDPCAALVKTLPAQDAVIEAAQSRPTAADTPEALAVRTLVERLRKQGPPPTAAVDSGTLALTPGSDTNMGVGPAAATRVRALNNIVHLKT